MGHNWGEHSVLPGKTLCLRCGVLLRRDGKNYFRECKGKPKVGPRTGGE